jgi:serine protease inhibitor
VTTLIRSSAILALGFLALRCSDLGTNVSGPSPHPMPPLNSFQKGVVNSANTFGLKMFRDMDRRNVGQNVLISPLSVSMALGMALNGARGSTEDAIRQTLGFAGMVTDDINSTYAELTAALTSLDPTVTMDIANSVWYRPELQVEQAFKDVNAAYFGAQIQSLDFSDPSAAGVINGWVSDATRGKILSIVPDPIPSGVVMYLINAIYFKGTWTFRFDSTATRDDDFILTGGAKTPCRMMIAGDSIAYLEADGLQAVELTYGSAGFSMTILLPPGGTDIDQFIADLTPEKWDGWVQHLTTTNVEIHLPKFKIPFFALLNPHLVNLGMGIAFSDAADFRGIDRRGNLAISEVLHKTFIQVDEAGTEAAAVTSIGFRATSVGGGGGIPVIILNRPFLYVIRERLSGTILFIGKLAQPVWQE